MKKKSEIVTFKADPELAEALSGISNRSNFIRNAVLAALGSVCPLCAGSGILSLSQQEHWRSFTQSHRLEECHVCEQTHLVCLKEEDPTKGPSDEHA